MFKNLIAACALALTLASPALAMGTVPKTGGATRPIPASEFSALLAETQAVVLPKWQALTEDQIIALGIAQDYLRFDQVLGAAKIYQERGDRVGFEAQKAEAIRLKGVLCVKLGC